MREDDIKARLLLGFFYLKRSFDVIETGAFFIFAGGGPYYLI